MDESRGEPSEIPEGFWSGFFFLGVIALAAFAVVVQLVIAKQFIVLGVVVTVVAGLATLFVHKASHSRPAGRGNSEEKQ